MIPKDKLGQEIKVGSYIAYGHALGRCAGLRIGIVREIIELKKEDHRWQEDAWTFRVRGIDDDWSYEKPWNFELRSLCGKDGRLGYLTRIVVLTKEQVPEEYRKLLDTCIK